MTMINPQINIDPLASTGQALDSFAKQLWPTMLFITVMSGISLLGGIFWASKLEPMWIANASYILWFLGLLIITGFALHAFIIDYRIQLATRTKAQSIFNDTGNSTSASI
jgi:hypothetical protein